MARKREQANRTKSKKSAGGFIATLLILIIAGGVVFFVGWMQFRLEEGEYAVVYRKSHGYETELIRNENFDWRWEALFPTYLTLHKFNLKPQTVDIMQNGVLPSGRIYNSIIGDGINFNWEIEARINYRVNPNSLVPLVKSGFDDLGSFYSDYEAKLNSAVPDMINQIMINNPNEVIVIGQEWFSDSMKRSAIDERVEIVEASLIRWRYPDMALYAEARRLTLETMRERQAVVSEIENIAAKLESTQETRLKLLRGYGQVLDEYPLLIDFLALEEVPIESILLATIE